MHCMRGAGTQTARSLPGLLHGLTLLWLPQVEITAMRVPTLDTYADLFVAIGHLTGMILIERLLDCR